MMMMAEVCHYLGGRKPRASELQAIERSFEPSGARREGDVPTEYRPTVCEVGSGFGGLPIDKSGYLGLRSWRELVF